MTTNLKNRKGRVLYTAFDVVPSPKGASTHILHFTRGLVDGGYTVDMLTPNNGTLPAEEWLEGAHILRTPVCEQGNFLERASAYTAAVMMHVESAPPYNIAHYRSFWGGLPLAQAKKRLGHQTLFEVNGLASVELKYHYPGLQESGVLTKIREQELAALALSDALVCPSEVTRAYLVSLGVPGDRITVIPNGVSPSDFSVTPLPSQDGHTPVLLYLGTLADWQGLDDLVGAMPSILAQRSVQLRIVGRGRSRQRKLLTKRIRKMGVEQFVSLEPAVPHHLVPALIAQADVCVAPLGLNDRNVTQGCCPIKVLEYMASNRPLVASNLPVVRELAREDIDALFFSPGDPSDLARQVLRMLDDYTLAENLASNAVERVQAHFTWHTAQKKLLKVYAKLLGNE
jgi:glycosyltransferase involved in cell wall biosynthesis